MISQSENRIEHLGTTIIFVLCLFFLVSFHQKSADKPNFSGEFQLQTAAHHLFAIQTKDIPQLSSLQGFISKFKEINSIHFTEQLKLLTDNRLINQRILFFQRVELLIKPIYQEFDSHQQSLYSEDISVLS